MAPTFIAPEIIIIIINIITISFSNIKPSPLWSSHGSFLLEKVPKHLFEHHTRRAVNAVNMPYVFLPVVTKVFRFKCDIKVMPIVLFY